MSNDIKQVIVIRKDLKMRRGKEIAQGSHASMAFLVKNITKKLTETQEEWLNSSHKKICLIVNSEEELLDIHENAIKNGIESHLITDSGFTEFKGVPTKTCIAIGPDHSVKIDKITSHLKLY